MTRREYIEKISGIYSVIGVLSTKNDGQVLRLRHRESGRDIVLRSYSVKQVAYEVLSCIECENLPCIYDTVTLDDGQIVLEEYIDALTVSQVMEGGKYRPAGAKKIVKAVCRALSVLHSFGLVHRDVKPENVMVDKRGRVVLIDFNAARKVSSASRDTVVMGTVGYASPEQLGILQSDARADIYALGIMLNVMVTGKHPSEKMASGKLGNIVRKCTSLNPDERYQSAEKLANAL